MATNYSKHVRDVLAVILGSIKLEEIASSFSHHIRSDPGVSRVCSRLDCG